MQTRCRVEDETREYLEAEARLEIEHELRERTAEVLSDLNIQTCISCDQNQPSTEFMYEDICEACVKNNKIKPFIVEFDHGEALEMNDSGEW